jgi:ABC-type nitrate/sulfonate/bicarbonate transport system substrate-binding protein
MNFRVAGPRLPLFVVAATASVAVAACGSSSSDSTSSKASSGAATAAATTSAPATISIGLPVPVTDYSVVLVAQAEGFFKKHGVNVTIKENLGANALNDLASGQVDLLIYATTAALTLNSKGQKVKAIYGFEQDPGAAIVGGKKVSTIQQLQAMKSCNLATPAQGSQGYGYATLYKKQLGLKCDIQQAPSQDVQLARVASGASQATVTNYTGALNTIRASGGHMLVNPLEPGYRAKYNLPPEYLTGMIFGKAATVTSKGDTIVKFLQGINDAAAFATPANAEKVAKDDATFDMFKGVPYASLLQQVKAILPFNNANANPIKPPAGADATEKAKIDYKPGYVTDKAWTDGLNAFVAYGLTGYDPKAPAVQRDAVVDMSYLTKAYGQ